ncbi:MAG: dihydroorotase [Oscillospiraceae bacterium]|nr:dihydroorotase [Oscillospiraceae bacterium]
MKEFDFEGSNESKKELVVNLNSEGISIENGFVFNGESFSQKDVFCCEGVIKNINDNFCDEVYKIDANGILVSPGFIDLHVHLREPGFEYKETIKTGTAAAVAGGFTTVCSMPNLNPVPDNKKNLKIQQDIIKKDARCRVFPFMSITTNRNGEKIVLPHEGSIGISDDGDGVQDDNVMARAMMQAKKTNTLISAHCEDKKLVDPLGCIHDGIYSQKNGFIGISSVSEYNQIERDLKLVKKTGCKYHVCHLSTKEGIHLVRRAKSDGLPVTCEVTPHHLLLCEDDIKDDGSFKMAPPLRSRNDKEALIEGLLDGTIDAIATDHAPHTVYEKEKGLLGSAMGIVGLECAFSVLYTDLVLKNIISLEKLLFLMTFSPAKIIGAKCGVYSGNNADITLIDPKKEWTIKSCNFFSKGKSTPFEGKKVKGKIIYTIVDGKIAYNSPK